MTSETKEFSQSSDESLVRLIQNGYRQAESSLIERYRESVRTTAAAYTSRFASHCSVSSIEFDDLFQEGLMGLLSAAYTFKAEKNVLFRTYAAKCISNSIKTAITASLRKKHIPPGGIVSIDEIELPAKESLEDIIISEEETINISSFLENGLSVLEASVIRLHLSAKSYSDIAHTLGITEKAVDNALQRARAKLSRYLRNNRS